MRISPSAALAAALSAAPQLPPTDPPDRRAHRRPAAAPPRRGARPRTARSRAGGLISGPDPSCAPRRPRPVRRIVVLGSGPAPSRSLLAAIALRAQVLEPTTDLLAHPCCLGDGDTSSARGLKRHPLSERDRLVRAGGYEFRSAAGEMGVVGPLVRLVEVAGGVGARFAGGSGEEGPGRDRAVAGGGGASAGRTRRGGTRAAAAGGCPRDGGRGAGTGLPADRVGAGVGSGPKEHALPAAGQGPGLRVVPAKVEGVRSKAKCLAERGWARQVRPGVFTALAAPAG